MYFCSIILQYINKNDNYNVTSEKLELLHPYYVIDLYINTTITCYCHNYIIIFFNL